MPGNPAQVGYNPVSNWSPCKGAHTTSLPWEQLPRAKRLPLLPADPTTDERHSL